VKRLAPLAALALCALLAAPARAGGPGEAQPLHADVAYLARLLNEASLDVAGYTILDLPAVELLTVDEMSARFGPGRGYYRLNVIALRDDRPLGEALGDAVLYHEMVHHVQEKTGAFAQLSACERWVAREAQAYELTARFLARRGLAVRFLGGMRCPGVLQ
jgi:hypothetical protein